MEFCGKSRDLMIERVGELAEVITREEGKILAEATGEATRASEIIALSAEEAKRLTGETIPLEGAPGVKNKLGFTVARAVRYCCRY